MEADVIQINTNGLILPLPESKHFVFNVACGQTTDLTTLWNMIKDITKATSQVNYGPNRKGDIMFSLANIENAKKILGYLPDADIKKQMESTIEYYKFRYFRNDD